MTTDRELLELAAKAAEHNVRWHENWQCFVHADLCNIDNPPTMAGQRHVWLPLTDDGDALRLAVKLNLHEAIKLAHRLLGGEGREDMYAATRRAIVRAAAEIGKATK